MNTVVLSGCDICPNCGFLLWQCQGFCRKPEDDIKKKEKPLDKKEEKQFVQSGAGPVKLCWSFLINKKHLVNEFGGVLGATLSPTKSEKSQIGAKGEQVPLKLLATFGYKSSSC